MHRGREVSKCEKYRLGYAYAYLLPLCTIFFIFSLSFLELPFRHLVSMVDGMAFTLLSLPCILDLDLDLDLDLLFPRYFFFPPPPSPSSSFGRSFECSPS